MELLAPAGNWDSFMAALKNGADAVYLGGKRYSARQSAENFDDEQMREAVVYAHLRKKKIYVTVNTLIDNQEFGAALDYLYLLQQIGVDAIIIQDMGLMNVARKVLPDLRLHASTQMNLHNQDGVAFLRDQGVKRIVLARELSMAEITAITKEAAGVELEVFVHGAICFSFSGQCLFSSMVGGRSGNRGRCSQPCRLPYHLFSRPDKQPLKLPEQGRYLLSPADLCLIEYLPELQRAGVTSLKIEGRMKRAEYVAVVTGAYRQALDCLEKDSEYKINSDVKDKLLKVFNRHFSTGYFIPDRQQFLSTTRPNNRGVNIGRVLNQERDMLVQIKLTDTVGVGDGLAIWVGQGKSPTCVIREMMLNGHKVEEARAGDIISVKIEGRVFPHDRVFKTHDEQLLSQARESIRDKADSRLPVDCEIHMIAGRPMQLALTDESGIRVEVQSTQIVQVAQQHPLDENTLREKLGRMGNTAFELRRLKISGDPNTMLPYSEINDVRRRAIDLLNARILQGRKTEIKDDFSYRDARKQYLSFTESGRRDVTPLLSVAVSSGEQTEIALQCGADRVYIGIEGLGTRNYPNKKHLKELLTMGGKNVDAIVPLLPRIHKPDDNYMYRDLVGDFRRLMIASWADLKWGLTNGFELQTDYNLNIYNRYALDLLVKMGVGGVCLSPELNFEQLHSFANFDKVELLVHGELILMLSQHCMLGSAVNGKQEKCSSPCVGHNYCLQDDKAYQFPLATDADCRFYVFNSRSLCMLEDLPKILKLCPAGIRIEARRLTNEQLRTTVKIYRQAFNELQKGLQPDWRAYQQELSAVSPSTFTKGHYYRGVL